MAMSNSVHQVRPALMQAIDRALDRIGEKVAADFQERDAQWQKKYDDLKNSSAEIQKGLRSRIDTLAERVKCLISDLEQAQAARPAGTPEAPSSSGGGGSSSSSSSGSNEPPTGASEPSIAELLQSLEKSQARYESVKVQLGSTVAVAQKRKAEVLRWIQYAESLEHKIGRLSKKAAAGRQASGPPPQPGEALPPTAAPAAPENPPPQALPDVPKPSLSASFCSSLTSSTLLGTPNPADEDENEEPELPSRAATTAASASAGPPNETALESTQGEPSSDASQPELPALTAGLAGAVGAHVAIKAEPPSDGPEVVWERPAKRPKRNDAQRNRDGRDEQPLTPKFLPAVKREGYDSTPWAAAAPFRASQESMDLDEGQLTVQTPRKRHVVIPPLPLAEIDTDEPSESSPRQEKTTAPGSNLGDAPPPPSPPAPRPLPSQSPAMPLAPLSVNARRRVKDPVKAMKHLKRGVESLAEDKQDYGTPSGAPKRAALDPPSTAKASRLSSLLNSRPAEPSPVLSRARPTPSAPERVFDNPMQSPISGIFGQPPPPRILPHLQNGGKASPRTPTTGASSRGSAILTPAASTGSGPRLRDTRELRQQQQQENPDRAAPTTPAVRPLTAALMAAKAESAAKRQPSLRGQPVNQLKMDDFRINPAANNGETFAYSEVVRSRGDRATLAGCTDPQCCGKTFRSMAESELDAAGRGHIGRPDSVVLMERHLGDDAFLLARMPPEEKRELWIEARSKELADKYGKHRHRYHRRASPPGFWDTEFPTTQEEEQNRAEAEKLERLTVQERYREAMRPGGRWLFRDE